MMKRVSAVEVQLRRKPGKTKGKMGLKRGHVLAVIYSNADAQTIGKPRGGIVWMVVMERIATRRHVGADMSFKAEHTELLRAKGLAAMGQRPEGTAHKVGLTQSVSEWLKKNEEQKGGNGGAYVIRPGKWNQMKDAKERRSGRTGSDGNTNECAGKSHDATTTEQANEQREVGELGGDLGQTDDTTRMADGG